MNRRHERPLRRENPSGKVVWVARYPGADGKRRSAGTFDLKREAQAAINDAYVDDKGASTPTVGSYAAQWLARHPRTERTEASYRSRLRAVLDVPVDGRPLRDWRLGALRRPQAAEILDVLLRDQGRAAKGAKGVLLVLSAMFSDAMEDGRADMNPFLGMRVRSADPRVQKAARRPVVASWAEMHAFAAACGQYEPMVRVLSDCGLRLGEMFPLERADVDGDWLEVRKTAWRGRVQQGTKTDHGEADAGRRTPIPPGLLGLLEAMPRRIDTRLLFPNPHGEVWHDRRFYDLVWYPAQRATGLKLLPHGMRHSYVSLMRAAGVNPGDLADWAGHSVDTATSVYTHGTGGSVELGRAAVGA
jgi:integrase